MTNQHISGASQLLGLLGHPVSHSLSPAMHNATCAALGLDCVYVPLDIAFRSQQQIARFLEDLQASNFLGFNVTLPYKSWVAESLDCKLASVNTVYRGEQNQWQATSTDGLGFLQALSQMVPFESIQHVVCIGNGGAALAALSTLAEQRPELPIQVLRRTKRDQLWRQNLACQSLEFLALTPEALRSTLESKKKTLLIQASSAPVHGDPLDALAAALPEFDGVVIDMVYGYRSAIFQEARRRALPCQSGIPMLIEQARVSQRLWFGNSLDYQQILEFLQTQSLLPSEDH